MEYVSSSVTEDTTFNFDHDFNKTRRDKLDHIHHDETDQNVILKVPRI